MSEAMSSTRMRQPSCSPKNVTLLPTTGPRSRSNGFSLPCRQLRNFCNALVAYDASATLVTDVSAAPAVSATLREPRMPNKSVSERVDSAIGQLRADALSLLLLRRLVWLRRLLTLRLRLPLLWLIRFGLRLHRGARAGTLHIDAAAEMRALGDGHARRRDITVHRTVVANVDLFRRRDVAGHFAEHHHGFGEHFRLDLAVWTDGEHVALQIDASFDMTFDGEIFTSAQLALNDHRFPDIHHVPPELSPRLACRRPCSCRRRRRSRRTWRRGRGRFNRLVTLPHL